MNFNLIHRIILLATLITIINVIAHPNTIPTANIEVGNTWVYYGQNNSFPDNYTFTITSLSVTNVATPYFTLRTIHLYYPGAHNDTTYNDFKLRPGVADYFLVNILNIAIPSDQLDSTVVNSKAYYYYGVDSSKITNPGGIPNASISKKTLFIYGMGLVKYINSSCFSGGHVQCSGISYTLVSLNGIAIDTNFYNFALRTSIRNTRSTANTLLSNNFYRSHSSNFELNGQILRKPKNQFCQIPYISNSGIFFNKLNN